MLLSRTGMVWFAFFVLYHSGASQPPPSSRCGFAVRATPERVAKLREGVQALLRPSLPNFIDAPLGKFRVHFTTVGTDAVSAADTDGNGTPDYVDHTIRALELAWRAEVDTLGYLSPPPDGTDGGSGALDVYVRDLSKAGPSGTSYYGVTNLDRLLASSPAERYTTWMEVDNNFAESDRDMFGNQAFSTFGTDALRVTCAHEFHHVIQNGSYGLSDTQLMFYELSSTWMEMRVCPDVRDWAVYTNVLLGDPEQWPFSLASVTNGYLWGWFGNVLVEVSPSTMLEMWQKIALKTRPFQALVDACGSHGVTFADVFCTHLPALYNTGWRGASNPYIPGADSLNEIRLYTNERAIAPSVISTGILKPFEVRVLRFSVPSNGNLEPTSLAVMLTWPNEAAFVSGNSQIVQSYTVTVTSTPSGADAVIPGTTWGVRVSPSDVCVVLNGAQTRKPTSAFPQPISLSTTRRLYIPVTTGIPGTSVTITLMTAMTVGIVATTVNVELNGDLIVAPFDLPESLTPGTYLVRVESGSTSSLQKISVRR